MDNKPILVSSWPKIPKDTKHLSVVQISPQEEDSVSEIWPVEETIRTPSTSNERQQDLHLVAKADPLAEINCNESSPDTNTNSNRASVSFIKTKGNQSTFAAVVMSNATKSYGPRSPLVLDNFNMCVPHGTIYSLLGSSGCGKTTALTCIVGTKQLNGGNVLVFGAKPGTKESGVPGGRVGYMPQDLALYHDFSICEMIKYYGVIYGMASPEIISKKELLRKLLNLPDESTRIATLSGGQKRRVSLAVALIHSPELLILDEPTVGVDPLLRESIWNHLCHLVSSQKTTVIITTHYIEEARKSHTIGLMRGGRLLTEKNPEDLIRDEKAISLEEIVLKLCRTDDDQTNSNTFDNDSQLSCADVADTTSIVSPSSMDEGRYRRKTSTVQLEDFCWKQAGNKLYGHVGYDHSNDSLHTFVKRAKSGSSFFTRIKALVMKNIALLVRNYIFVVFLLGCPAMQIWIACTAIGNEPKPLRVGVVNKETNGVPCSSILSSNNESFFESCDAENLSCKYLEKFPSDAIYLTEYATYEDALKAAQSGSIWGVISFPEDFSDQLYVRLSGGGFIDNETLVGSQISFQMDMSSNHIAMTLQVNFHKAYKLLVSELLLSCGFDPAIGESPLKFLTPIYGTEETNFKDFIAPSAMLSMLYFFPLCSSSISYIWDKKQGTLERSRVAGVKTWEVITAFVITEGSVIFFQLIICFTMLIFVFGINIQGSICLAISICILIGISGLSLGFLIGLFCNEEVEAVLIIMGTFFPNVMLSGVLWPVQGMPLAMQYFAYLIPCTLASESLRSIISRGWGFRHINVWPGFVATFAWILIYLFFTVRIHKISLARK